MEREYQDVKQPDVPTADEQTAVAPGAGPGGGRLHCAIRIPPTPVFMDGISATRAVIVEGARKRWINGTLLRYYFFNQPQDGSQVKMSDGTFQWRTWVGQPAQQQVVRWAFGIWKSLGIGLDFQEVFSRDEAEIRIGFAQGDGSWSYVGREDVLSRRDGNQRTMNFGWSLTDSYGHDTALHEIGHTLGMMHEHQSPFSGIEWDEPAVYAAFGKGTDNNWEPQEILDNILTKADPASVTGSSWDVNSVMQYWFSPGLVKRPKPYDTAGIYPAGGLSPLDVAWIRHAYPPMAPAVAAMAPGRVESLAVANGEQRDFKISPPQSGSYTIRASGPGDTLLVLFENAHGTMRYVRGDDDSGQDRNATLQVDLKQGGEYVLRARQVFNEDPMTPAELLLEKK